MRFKYEDVVLEIIEGDAIHPKIFSFENQGSFYERINLALDEENGRCKKCCFHGNDLCYQAPRCGNGDAIYDSFHRDYPRIGKTESACYFVRLKENPLHKINYDALLIEEMEI